MLFPLIVQLRKWALLLTLVERLQGAGHVSTEVKVSQSISAGTLVMVGGGGAVVFDMEEGKALSKAGVGGTWKAPDLQEEMITQGILIGH